MWRSFVVLVLGGVSVMEEPASRDNSRPGYSSPGQVWDAYRHARHERRWKDVFRCLTSEAHERFIGSVVFSAAYLQKTPEKKIAAKLRAILWKHGLDLDQIEAKAGDDTNVDYVKGLVRNVKDKEGLFDEAMTVVQAADREPRGKNGKRVITLGELKSIQVIGDRARGKCLQRLDDRQTFELGAVRQTEMELEVEFRRIDGRWFVDSSGG